MRNKICQPKRAHHGPWGDDSKPKISDCPKRPCAFHKTDTLKHQFDGSLAVEKRGSTHEAAESVACPGARKSLASQARTPLGCATDAEAPATNGRDGRPSINHLTGAVWGKQPRKTSPWLRSTID